jgi:hypothetical protein
LISNILGVGVAVQLTMSVSVVTRPFLTGVAQAGRTETIRQCAFSRVRDLILKQSTPLGSALDLRRGDDYRPMKGTTFSQSLVIEASRMKGEEKWAVATKGSLTSLVCPHTAAA